jgi:hypothetical protein
MKLETGTYYVTDRGTVGLFDGHFFCTVGYKTSDLRNLVRVATAGEVAEMEHTKAIREERRRKAVEQEKALLAQYGLKMETFARYRGCFEEAGQLVVCTREGGVDYCSPVDNHPLLVGHEYDESDRTYVYWTFKK